MNQYDDEVKQAPSFSGPALMFWLALFGGTAYFFYSNKDYVGLGCAIAIAITCFGGYRMGAAKIAATLVGLAAAIWYAPGLGASQAHWFDGLSNANEQWSRFCSVAAAGVLITLVVSIVGALIAGKIMKNRPNLNQANKWFGFLVGGAEGAIAVLLLLGGILIVEPLVKESAQSNVVAQGNVLGVADAVLTVAEETRESSLGPIVKEYNPFTRFPELNQFDRIRKTVEDYRSSSQDDY